MNCKMSIAWCGSYHDRVTLGRVRVQTKGEAAYQAVREAILSGRLEPGQRVTLQGLATQLGMSLTPVREALALLANQGLVHQQSNRYTVVTEYTRESAEEIYRLRLALEPLAAELAARRRDQDDLAAIDEALSELDVAVAERTTGDVPELNASLHRRIYQAARSPSLLEFIDRLWNGIPLQTISLVNRQDKSSTEHHTIVDALHRRQHRRAANLMRAHIAGAAEQALDRIDHIASKSLARREAGGA